MVFAVDYSAQRRSGIALRLIHGSVQVKASAAVALTLEMESRKAGHNNVRRG